MCGLRMNVSRCSAMLLSSVGMRAHVSHAAHARMWGPTAQPRAAARAAHSPGPQLSDAAVNLQTTRGHTPSHGGCECCYGLVMYEYGL